MTVAAQLPAPRPVGDHMVNVHQTCVWCGVRYDSFDACRDAPCEPNEAL
jgi:hypothetical protein